MFSVSNGQLIETHKATVLGPKRGPIENGLSPVAPRSQQHDPIRYGINTNFGLTSLIRKIPRLYSPQAFPPSANARASCTDTKRNKKLPKGKERAANLASMARSAPLGIFSPIETLSATSLVIASLQSKH